MIKVSKMEVHDKLAHLSPEQLNDLINRYQNGIDKISDLVKEFNIDAKPAKLVSLFPPIIYDNLFCPYCDDTNLVSKVKGRTTSSYYAKPPYCSECGHQNSERCNCDNCKEEADYESWQNEKNKRDIIKAENTREIEIADTKQVSLKDAVFILSLTRHSLSEDLKFVEPFSNDEIPLAPVFEFQNEIVKHLYSKGFINISSESPVNAFIFDQAETCTDAYYPTQVFWEFLPSLDVEGKREYLKELQSTVKSNEWPEEWHSDVSKLWHQIAKYECLEYFLYLLDQRDFKLDKIGEKTHTTFEDILESFSVSRIYNLSWMAVRDTTDYIVRENISSWHGKNIFIGAIQRKAERARAEGWELRHSRRDYNCPQTVVSSTFFNLFLNIGDKAFETVAPEIDKGDVILSVVV